MGLVPAFKVSLEGSYTAEGVDVFEDSCKEVDSSYECLEGKGT